VIETASMLTRDGVRLDADIYRPAEPGPHPVLLMRQPYGRRIASTICYAHPTWYAARGYIVVIQDVRGRGTSEGTFRLFAHEALDGYDAIAWAAQLPGSSGAVGMYGFSYQGTDQLLAAALAPPALKAVAPAMVGWNLRTDWAYENGAFCLRGGLGWAVQLAAETARRAGDTVAFRDLCAAAESLPLNDLVPAQPEVMERYRRYTHYFDWLDTPQEAPSWDAISPAASARERAASGLPMLLVGGWYDTHLPGTLAAYHAIAAARSVPVRLVVGPWVHAPWTRRVGSLDFGPRAIGEIDQIQVRWFDRWLKGVDTGIDREPPIQLFDMGACDWIDLVAWPARDVRLFLASSGRAALDERSGLLVLDSPTTLATDYLVHDPWRPAPTLGGAYGVPPGPVERAPVEARPDVMTFTTPPLEEPLSLAGNVFAALRVIADAPDFDMSCVLARVLPDGRSFEIASGYRRITAAEAGEVLEAGEALAVPMRATCVTLAPGDALRLSLAGASFPAYPVNPGTGSDPTSARRADARIVTLGVRCGGPAGSALVVGVRA
jgi:putative CocE/NonD family hydrolase